MSAAETAAQAGAADDALSGSPFGHGEAPAAAAAGPDVLAGLRVPTDLSQCLLPLLEALGWHGHPQQVAEALPHFVDTIDITSLRNIMAVLGYESRAEKMRMDKVDAELMPCLFLPDGGDALVLVGVDGGRVQAFESTEGRYVGLADADLKGSAYFFSSAEASALSARAATGDWFWTIGDRFRPLAYEVLAISFAINLLALATPLFVMAAYDRAIESGSAGILAYLAVGVAIALVCDVVLKSLRARVFSFLGARVDIIVGVEVFRKILYLPAAVIERAAIGAQMTRIRDFETVREFFTGPAAPVLFEFPFILVFIAAIFYLGGPIALVPIIVLVLVGALGLAVMPRIGKARATAAESSLEKHELTVETLGGMTAIKVLAAEDTWLERYRRVSAAAALRHFHAAQFSSLLATLSYLVMMGTGFSIVVFGVGKVQAGDMTLGALVACMILAWRVLLPLQTGLVSLAHVTEVEAGVGQLNELMKSKQGRKRTAQTQVFGPKGQVTFVDVSFRYNPDSLPALDHASFDIGGGRITAVLGDNGAGKSTMLKLITGVYEADEGAIMIDGRDLRNMGAAELRQLVAYVPQTPQFFYGTVAQNLRLAHPTASDEDLRWAARQAGALDDIEALEQGSGDWRRTGFEVRLGDSGGGELSPGLMQRLNLARGYLKRSPILLLDEPGNGLDIEGDRALMRALANLRGEKTVFIVTHRPSHLKMADRIVWLANGSVRAAGKSKVVLKETQGQMI